MQPTQLRASSQICPGQFAEGQERHLWRSQAALPRTPQALAVHKAHAGHELGCHSSGVLLPARKGHRLPLGPCFCSLVHDRAWPVRNRPASACGSVHASIIISIGSSLSCGLDASYHPSWTAGQRQAAGRAVQGSTLATAAASADNARAALLSRSSSASASSASSSPGSSEHPLLASSPLPEPSLHAIKPLVCMGPCANFLSSRVLAVCGLFTVPVAYPCRAIQFIWLCCAVLLLCLEQCLQLYHGIKQLLPHLHVQFSASTRV